MFLCKYRSHTYYDVRSVTVGIRSPSSTYIIRTCYHPITCDVLQACKLGINDLSKLRLNRKFIGRNPNTTKPNAGSTASVRPKVRPAANNTNNTLMLVVIGVRVVSLWLSGVASVNNGHCSPIANRHAWLEQSSNQRNNSRYIRKTTHCEVSHLP